ncbi:sporulation protein YlmC with PRC-barrel domain [Microvirga flocculans]|uniref:Sporulation protein YlmC with PRC-barrel domain n=1 Tax=Microvirga flocculans TaxID=217168 RepID=A0A7W6N6Y4_9HYPH|nr:PRC-barrel domain-containing protein [Microvirga flocculans]MBB4038763.1 sporulation protein YlmC with PRC-barrel domain [Microvirga flocculans]
MLFKHLATAFLGTALIAAPALAQQPQSPSTTSGTTMMNTGNWMTHEQPGQWRASKLRGLNVYNNNNEKIGDISELLVDQNGKIEAVVIGVGGFLGMGEHDVAVPFEQLKLMNEPRRAATATGTTAPATTGSTARTTSEDMSRAAPDHALLNMTKDQLKAAPQFKYSR